MRLSVGTAFLICVFISHVISGSCAAGVPRCAPLIAKSKSRLRSLEDVLFELHGGNALKPSSQSRLGRYLKKTGAAVAVRRFAKNRKGDRGPEKLVVAVSRESFPEFYKFFGEKYPNALEHLHYPNQGTLLVRWMTETFQYARPHGRWRFPTEGSIGPLIVLSDSEAKRAHEYWTLNHQLRNRYELRDMSYLPWRIPGYGFPEDAYGDNCTTWFSMMPLGDDVFSSVTVGGSVDEYGDGQGRAARTASLADYSLPEGMRSDSAAGKLLRKIWSFPIHERLWDLLGIPYRLANHTNPGWVALSLTGLTDRTRVPMVIYYTNDHTTLPARLDTQIELVGG